MPSSKRGFAEVAQQVLPRKRLDTKVYDPEYSGTDSWLIIEDETSGQLETFIVDPTVYNDNLEVVSVGNNYPLFIRDLISVHRNLCNQFSVPIEDQLSAVATFNTQTNAYLPINPEIASYVSLGDRLGNNTFQTGADLVLPEGKSLFLPDSPPINLFNLAGTNLGDQLTLTEYLTTNWLLPLTSPELDLPGISNRVTLVNLNQCLESVAVTKQTLEVLFAIF